MLVDAKESPRLDTWQLRCVVAKHENHIESNSFQDLGSVRVPTSCIDHVLRAPLAVSVSMRPKLQASALFPPEAFLYHARIGLGVPRARLGRSSHGRGERTSDSGRTKAHARRWAVKAWSVRRAQKGAREPWHCGTGKLWHDLFSNFSYGTWCFGTGQITGARFS